MTTAKPTAGDIAQAWIEGAELPLRARDTGTVANLVEQYGREASKLEDVGDGGPWMAGVGSARGDVVWTQIVDEGAGRWRMIELSVNVPRPLVYLHLAAALIVLGTHPIFDGHRVGDR